MVASSFLHFLSWCSFALSYLQYSHIMCFYLLIDFQCDFNFDVTRLFVLSTCSCRSKVLSSTIQYLSSIGSAISPGQI